jgi:hypothetical protein
MNTIARIIREFSAIVRHPGDPVSDQATKENIRKIAS